MGAGRGAIAVRCRFRGATPVGTIPSSCSSSFAIVSMAQCVATYDRLSANGCVILILNMSPFHSWSFMQTFLLHWGRFVGQIGLAEVRTGVFEHVRSIINCMTVLMISEPPLMTIMLEDARTLTTEISSSNHI